MRKVLLSVAALVAMSSYAIAQESKVESKVPVLKFSGKHYFGFVQKDSDVTGETTNGFETRRNYLQVKAYFEEDSKDHVRLTLDTKDKDGETYVRLKYAYLYLDDILPYTGVEMGQVHRPWIDNEQNGGWNYRSIYKVFVEQTPKLTASADRGINFKTKMENFSSELGVFNGEGYSDAQVADNLSLEWRLTYHALGGGTKKSKPKHTYTNISFFGQQNTNKDGEGDLNWYGLHAVYNQPEFLLAAQFVQTKDAIDDHAGEGYSINGEYRFMPKWNIIGRYDFYEFDKDSAEKTNMLAGVAHKYNSNVEFIANIVTEEKEASGVKSTDDTKFMLTAEVKW